MVWLKEKGRTAFVATFVNTHFKTFLIAWLVVVSLAGAAYAGYLGIRDTRDYSEQIQESRKQFFLAFCEEGNARNKATIARLNANILALPDGPDKREAMLSRKGTVALIDAAIPRRDCPRFAAELGISPK